MSVFQNKVIPNFTNELVLLEMTTFLYLLEDPKSLMTMLKRSNVNKRKGRTMCSVECLGLLDKGVGRRRAGL